MSYVSQLLKGNRPTQNKEYDKLLQDIDTVTDTASKQWGAKGEPMRTAGYADRTRGARATQGMDDQRRIENQAKSGEIAAQGDQRRTNMQLGIEAAIADREMKGLERAEEGRQAREAGEFEMAKATRDFETDWRELAFKEYSSKMTNLDRLASLMTDVQMREIEVAARVQHGFSMQDIELNTKYNVNLLNENFKKWQQDKQLSFEELVAKMEAQARNTANITGGIMGVLGEIVGKIFGGTKE